jgi:hypothetical protein
MLAAARCARFRPGSFHDDLAEQDAAYPLRLQHGIEDGVELATQAIGSLLAGEIIPALVPNKGLEAVHDPRFDRFQVAQFQLPI